MACVFPLRSFHGSPQLVLWFWVLPFLPALILFPPVSESLNSLMLMVGIRYLCLSTHFPLVFADLLHLTCSVLKTWSNLEGHFLQSPHFFSWSSRKQLINEKASSPLHSHQVLPHQTVPWFIYPVGAYKDAPKWMQAQCSLLKSVMIPPYCQVLGSGWHIHCVSSSLPFLTLNRTLLVW